MLVRHQGEALWARVSAALRAEIAERFDEGDWLPPEPVLAARFGVHRHTLRRAVDELEAEGLVARVHGRGTRVLARRLVYDLGKRTRFTEQLAAAGRLAEVDLLDKREVAAAGGVARRLEVGEGTPVLRLRTLRGEAGVALCLSLHFLQGAPARIVAAHYRRGSLHGLLREHGITLERRTSLITARLPSPEDALDLGVPRNRPVLRVKGVNVETRDGTVVEYVISQFRGDRVELSVAEPSLASAPVPEAHRSSATGGMDPAVAHPLRSNDGRP